MAVMSPAPELSLHSSLPLFLPPPPSLQPGKAQGWLSCAINSVASELPGEPDLAVWSSAVGLQPVSDLFSPAGFLGASGDTLQAFVTLSLPLTS